MIFPKPIQDGEAVIRWNPNGTRDLITGPTTIFAPFARVQPLARFNAAEGEYLVITFRDGHTKHQAGPCHLWFDPLLHANILTKKATHLDTHEAIVIYTENERKNHTPHSPRTRCLHSHSHRNSSPVSMAR
ncbi:MAG: hypothetical protein P1U90_19705 [Akkermansiaceae bacterium]|nr:hypothetical protein [Akkermansiaceae bacterium]